MHEKLILGTLSSFLIKNELDYLFDFFNELSALGFKRIDSSPTYSQGCNEKILGKLLDRGINYEITSKVFADVNNSGSEGLNKKNILNSIDFSLSLLRVKKIDRLLLHNFDKNIDCLEISETINYLFKKKLISKIGFCKWSFEEVDKVIPNLNINASKIFAQYPYSFINTKYKNDLICFNKNNIETEVYGVLAQGTLLGNFKDRDDYINSSYKHHIKDPKAFVEYKKLSKFSKDKSDIAVNLIKKILDLNYVDNVILGFSSEKQIKEIANKI